MLTIQELKPTITDVNELLRNKETVGYQNGSFVFELLKVMTFDESKLLAFRSSEEMDELFRKGSANGGISAAFDEIPYVKLFLAKYCSKYIMVGPTYKTDGFGFVHITSPCLSRYIHILHMLTLFVIHVQAFPIGSPLVPDISRAILNVTGGKKVMTIEKNWLENNTKCADSSDFFSSNSLGLESFWGLFMIVGIAGVSALIIYVTGFLYENRHVESHTNAEATLGSKLLELFRRFNNKDLTCHTFKNYERIEYHNGCGCDCARRVVKPPNEHSHPSPSTFSPGNSGPPNPTSSSAEAQEASLTRLEGEESNVIKHEIELVRPHQSQQLASSSIGALDAEETKAVRS